MCAMYKQNGWKGFRALLLDPAEERLQFLAPREAPLAGTMGNYALCTL